MEQRGTVRLWRDNSSFGRELETSFQNQGFEVRTIITGSPNPVASHMESGFLAHGYTQIKIGFSLSEPCPLEVGDLPDEGERSFPLSDGISRLRAAMAKMAEEPDDDDDDDWDEDDDALVKQVVKQLEDDFFGAKLEDAARLAMALGSKFKEADLKPGNRRDDIFRKMFNQ